MWLRICAKPQDWQFINNNVQLWTVGGAKALSYRDNTIVMEYIRTVIYECNKSDSFTNLTF